MCTQSCTKGIYCLLILDSHGSHATPEFNQFCTINKIITLCMPAHTSHFLQPLDVSCYSPLKHTYGYKMQDFAHQRIYHIDKMDFLSIYLKVRPSVFSSQNIKSRFLATGLLPYNPQHILSLLSVLTTPSPLSTSNGLIL